MANWSDIVLVGLLVFGAAVLLPSVSGLLGGSSGGAGGIFGGLGGLLGGTPPPGQGGVTPGPGQLPGGQIPITPLPFPFFPVPGGLAGLGPDIANIGVGAGILGGLYGIGRYILPPLASRIGGLIAGGGEEVIAGTVGADFLAGTPLLPRTVLLPGSDRPTIRNPLTGATGPNPLYQKPIPIQDWPGVQALNWLGSNTISGARAIGSDIYNFFIGPPQPKPGGTPVAGTPSNSLDRSDTNVYNPNTTRFRES